MDRGPGASFFTYSSFFGKTWMRGAAPASASRMLPEFRTFREGQGERWLGLGSGLRAGGAGLPAGLVGGLARALARGLGNRRMLVVGPQLEVYHNPPDGTGLGHAEMIREIRPGIYGTQPNGFGTPEGLQKPGNSVLTPGSRPGVEVLKVRFRPGLEGQGER